MDLRNSIILATMMQSSETPGPGPSPVPERYTIVDYIQSTGGPYIDTGIYPDDTTVVQCKFIMTNSNGNTFIGNKGTGESDSFRFFRASEGTYLDYGSGSGYNRISGIYITSTTAIYECEFGNRYIKDLITGNILVSGASVSFNEKTYTISMFDSSDYGKMYYLKIKKQNSWVVDYVPVYDTQTQKYGMYDMISQTFKGNDGTGDFTGGNFDIVGTPTISSDNILSNFNNSNYLYTLDLYTSINHNYKLTTKFRIADLTKNCIIYGCEPDQSAIRLSYNSEGGQGSFSLLIPDNYGAGWVNSSNFIIPNAYTVANQWMWATIIKEDNLIQLLVSTDGANYSKIYEYDAGVYISSYIKGKQVIGKGDNNNTSEIDLKEVKYYLNGQLSWEAVNS